MALSSINSKISGNSVIKAVSPSAKAVTLSAAGVAAEQEDDPKAKKTTQEESSSARTASKVVKKGISPIKEKLNPDSKQDKEASTGLLANIRPGTNPKQESSNDKESSKPSDKADLLKDVPNPERFNPENIKAGIDSRDAWKAELDRQVDKAGEQAASNSAGNSTTPPAASALNTAGGAGGGLGSGGGGSAFSGSGPAATNGGIAIQNNITNNLGSGNSGDSGLGDATPPVQDATPEPVRQSDVGTDEAADFLKNT